jgi:hypothetical protein
MALLIVNHDTCKVRRIFMTSICQWEAHISLENVVPFQLHIQNSIMFIFPGGTQWRTLVRNMTLMPHPHCEENSQSYFTIKKKQVCENTVHSLKNILRKANYLGNFSFGNKYFSVIILEMAVGSPKASAMLFKHMIPTIGSI